MSEINFTNAEKDEIVKKIQQYCSNELGQDIGQFDAEFLLDFFTNEIGGYYYNRGLYDARQIFETKLEDIDEVIYAMEKDTTRKGT
tara:strand:- start:4285 stop:4542 length:258 start_codon:yes stop_codon:yes gene_type:complete